ncbi:hypothetical protein [Pseudactinotalea sp.]|uniref:hypothetical protein n=1 Tax=Pseudactinotalea sp. TaxID=1926260 RepID=UPI003B3B9DCF
MEDGPGMFGMISAASRTSLPVSEEARARARVRFRVLGPLHAIAWAVAAYASVPAYFDTFRVMAMNPVTLWSTPDVEAGFFVSIGGFFGGVMLASILGFSAMWAAMKAYGTFRLGNQASMSFSMAGIAVGLTAALVGGLWTAPAEVGVEAATEHSAAVPWGTWAWVMYYLPVGLAALFALLALWFTVRFFHGNRRSGEAEATQARIRATGWHVIGQITQVHFTNRWLMGLPQFEIEVAYHGSMGPSRISCMVVTEPTEAPQKGGQVDVWFDPADPSQVVVEAGPAASPNPTDGYLFMPRD